MRVIQWVAILAILLPAVPVDAQQTQSQALKNFKEQESYAMGVQRLRNLKKQGLDFDIDVLVRGMKDAYAGGKLLMDDVAIQDVLNAMASETRTQKTSERLAAGLDNREKEQKFLAENKDKEGVVTLPSGLQYKIIKAGNGKKPTAEDTVEVHYRGTIVDGTVFENTYDAGQPKTMQLSEFSVIAGLKEALKLMPVGSKWQLFIPSRLAYGQRGAGRVIGPYSMLIYELELVAIK
jgi:FKBP-type peptidyl-prolyl cis-trans isomerase FklB